MGSKGRAAGSAGGAAAQRPTAAQLGAAILAGAALTFAFAPFNLWPLAVACPAILIALLDGTAPRTGGWIGFAFGAGTFGAGTWWLYISIHDFGQSPVWLAIALIVALVAIMSAWYGLLGYAAARWLPSRGAARWLVGLPGLWLVVEWLRGWAFSGFPWLSLGYAGIDSPLAGWAPVLGVYGLTAAMLIAAGALVAIARGGARRRGAALAALIAPWLMGYVLGRVEWTTPAGAPVTVAIVQGDVPQEEKHLEQQRASIRALYTRLDDGALGARLILWPESALPEVANDLTDYLASLYGRARARGSEIVLGIVRESDDGEHAYNSMLALTSPPAWYDKRHLVPFGEYFPVPDSVRRWMRLMSLPYLDFTSGAAHQPPLTAGGLHLAASICYEDGYGADLLGNLAAADVLANVTNDAWFGHSPARYQHFQIARMRAAETRRFLLRAANDGVSGIVGPKGEVVRTAPEFTPTVLRGTVTPRRGLTPYARVGNWPVVSAALLAALFTIAWGRRGRRGYDGADPTLIEPDTGGFGA